MEPEAVKDLIIRELPDLLRSDAVLRDLVTRLARDFPSKAETEGRFDRMLDELRRDREASERKWDEQQRADRELRAEQAAKWKEQQRADRELRAEQTAKWKEQAAKWDEQQRADRELRAEQAAKWKEQQRADRELRAEQTAKWKEQQRADRELRAEQTAKWKEQAAKWDEQQRADRELRAEQAAKWKEQQRADQVWWEQNFAEIKALNRKHDTTLGALGARWGMRSEQSFRSALAGILEGSFGVKVQNYLGFDAAGVVFDHPAQIELDVLIKNGLLILCELKSSMSFADVSIFARKVAFYEKEHGVKSSRRLVISPMVDPKANTLAQQLNLEVYSHAEDLAEDGSATRTDN